MDAQADFGRLQRLWTTKLKMGDLEALPRSYLAPRSRREYKSVDNDRTYFSCASQCTPDLQLPPTLPAAVIGGGE